MREVYHLIRKLGATSKYKGYYFVAEAVKISMEAQERPIKITKDIYPFLAKKFKSTPMNVEHDIRTVINVCWTANKKTMDEIAGYSLNYRPRTVNLWICWHITFLRKEKHRSRKTWIDYKYS